ncbi:MAG: YtxH domain-containing protein [Bryobacteraceae bacterium]
MRDNGAIWFLVGFAVGGAVALLYAPQSGRKTRAIIGRKTEEASEFLGDTGREFLEKSKDLYERGREIAEEAAELVERGRKLVHG